MGNSYCKNDNSKGEVSTVEITQIRLPKMKENVAMANFGNKIVFYVVI